MHLDRKRISSESSVRKRVAGLVPTGLLLHVLKEQRFYD